MKDTHFLYAIAVLAIIGISATFIGYTTDTLPTNAQRQIATTTSANIDISKAKKGCSCCEDNLAAFKKIMEMHKGKKTTVQKKINTSDTTSK